MNRDPKTVLDLITNLDVVNNFAFLPHRRIIPPRPGATVVQFNGAAYEVTASLTFCNCYASVFFAALGCPVPPIKANLQYQWFQSNEAKMQGWQEIDKATAIARANLGYPVAVVSKNPVGNGHIGGGVPGPKGDTSTLWITAAGAKNFVRAKMEDSFGPLARSAKFFTRP